MARFVRCDMRISICAPAIELCAWAVTLHRCMQYGAKVKRKRCSQDGCDNQVIRGGVCVKHGAIWKRRRYC